MTINRPLVLDIFLGFVLLFLFLLGYPDAPHFSTSFLSYSAWDGLRFADFFLPSLIIGLGASTWFLKASLPNNSRFLKTLTFQSLGLFGLGLGLSFVFENQFSMNELRYWGLLQRLGFVIFLGGALSVVFSRRQLGLFGFALLLFYNLLTVQCGDLTLEGNALRRLDVFLFGSSHLYQGFQNEAQEIVAFDPFGLLGILPSLVSFIIGHYLGWAFDYFGKKKDQLIFVLGVMGVVFIAFGVFLNEVLPINLSLWSSAFVLTSTGLSSILLCFFVWLIDVLGWRKGTIFFRVFGTNVGLSLVLHIFLTKVTQWASLKAKIASFGVSDFLVSFSYAMLSLFLCCGIVWLAKGRLLK